ncbi:MAG: NifB/NifX family molybdenum-iron cluster-binding protein [Syntrophotaleaceae bacterium]
MKIAFTAAGNTLDARMDPRFARAAGYIIYDTETDTFVAVDNQKTLDTAHGAGILATESIVNQGVTCVVTGHCGPNAFRALSAAGISVFKAQDQTVAEALEAYRSGTLPAMESADVDGHWS